MLALRTLQRGAPRWLATRAASTTPVALVGCGMPGRGMGWYHAKQILDGDVPSATLTDIVEPWFLGGGADGPGGAEFAAFKKEHEGKVRFHSSIADMPKPDGKMMAMVCTRTADMPGYVDELVDHGVSHVFLEKPGAPTVDELGRMKDDCAKKGATIWMVRAAAWKWTLTRSPRWRLHETAPPRRRRRGRARDCRVSRRRPFRAGLQQERHGVRDERPRGPREGAWRRLYISPPQRLQGERVGRVLREERRGATRCPFSLPSRRRACHAADACLRTQGMLKNMAIHELALLVTFFGVNSETLSDVVADKAYSDLRTEKGPSSGDDFTDFSRIGFTVTTKAGAKVSVYADRCGLELPDGAMADGGMMRDSASVSDLF